MHPDVASAVDATNGLALDLYRRLAAAKSGNLFFSPSSISTALAMTYLGARGKTAAEMAETLHFSVPQDRLHHGYMHLIRRLGATDCQLRIANRLWGQETFEFLPEFIAGTQEQYGAELARADFGKHAKEAQQAINAWVAEQTENRIVDLIPVGVLNALTRLVLISAIYFKGSWTHPFEKHATKSAPFYCGAETIVSAPTMEQTELFGYAETEDAQLLSMPYGSGELSMVILLPKLKGHLASLEKSLGLELFRGWDRNEGREVHVFLPRFKLEHHLQLDVELGSMGMVEAFSETQADFSGMGGQRGDLYIAAAIHKALVEVDELGTVAAAATGVTMALRCSVPTQPIPTFRANHPFLFAIRHNPTGCLLFLGRVTNPAVT